VRYPDQEFVTANEIHIPTDQPVQVRLTSDDVIHSFWIPELHGKMDMIPGVTNTFWIEASEPGIYWGVCTEFCGIQHAKMAFPLVAKPAEEFAAWVESQQQPAPAPETELTQNGQEIFLNSACIYCHAVEGTNATGDLGPDLTHFASRLTLGAGAFENNMGNLSGWIVDPQQMKPGNLMPASSDLTGPELQALLAYLATLE
jgi:cytochrome c oxidase subunit 2